MADVPSIRSYLEGIGMGEYVEAFEASDITVDIVPLLSEAELRDDLGVHVLGHRLRILAAAAELGSPVGSPAGSDTVSGAADDQAPPESPDTGPTTTPETPTSGFPWSMVGGAALLLFIGVGVLSGPDGSSSGGEEAGSEVGYEEPSPRAYCAFKFFVGVLEIREKKLGRRPLPVGDPARMNILETGCLKCTREGDVVDGRSVTSVFRRGYARDPIDNGWSCEGRDGGP